MHDLVCQWHDTVGSHQIIRTAPNSLHVRTVGQICGDPHQALLERLVLAEAALREVRLHIGLRLVASNNQIRDIDAKLVRAVLSGASMQSLVEWLEKTPGV